MLPLPALKSFVPKEYLTDGQEVGWVEAYLMAIDARNGQALRFTVLLESGGIWSGLPIEAIYVPYNGDFSEVEKQKGHSTEVLQPFSCLEGPVSFIAYQILKDAEVETPLGPGQYLFTINYEGLGLAEDPEQYKTHNVITLYSSGQLCAMPNNMIKVKNNWFTNESDTSDYRRTSMRFFAGG